MGKGMYLWPYEEAEKAEIFDCIFLSNQANRPPELCKDGAKVEDVLKYHLEHKDFDADYICVIYPCAYGIRAEDIIKGFLQMIRNNREYCYSIGMVNSNAMDQTIDNGGFYWVKKEAFLRDVTFINKDAVKYETYQVDINTIEDFMEAKLDVYKKYRKRFIKECGACQSI